jgi:hypothetical protein
VFVAEDLFETDPPLGFIVGGTHFDLVGWTTM